MKLGGEQVDHIALLARLGMTPADREKFREQLSVILDNFEVLQEVDTTNVAPTAQAVALNNVFREDEVTPSLPRESVLGNAPQAEDGQFRVRAVLE